LHNVVNNTLNSIGAGRAFVNQYVKRTRFIDIAATPEDAARGPSNVRRQRVSQRKIAEASMFSELQKMFGETGLDKQLQADNLPGSTAWRAKMQARQTAAEARENNLLAEIAALASVTNLALPEDDGDDDENSVEVRIIPMSEMENELEKIEQITEVILEPIKEVRKLTALEILRARKGK